MLLKTSLLFGITVLPSFRFQFSIIFHIFLLLFFFTFTTFCIICHKPFLGGYPFYSIFHYKIKKDEPKFIKIGTLTSVFFWRIFVHLFIMPFFLLKGNADNYHCSCFSTKCWYTHGLEVLFGYIKRHIHIPFMTYYTVCLFYYFLLILSTFFYLEIPYLLYLFFTF